MSTRDEAIRVIREQTLVTDLATSKDIARKLEYAGLLAPDLPEPQEHGGKLVWPLPDPDEWAVSLHDGWVRLSDERGAIFTASRKLARDLGRILLAAGNHTEAVRGRPATKPRWTTTPLGRRKTSQATSQTQAGSRQTYRSRTNQ